MISVTKQLHQSKPGYLKGQAQVPPLDELTQKLYFISKGQKGQTARAVEAIAVNILRHLNPTILQLSRVFNSLAVIKKDKGYQNQALIQWGLSSLEKRGLQNVTDGGNCFQALAKLGEIKGGMEERFVAFFQHNLDKADEKGLSYIANGLIHLGSEHKNEGLIRKIDEIVQKIYLHMNPSRKVLFLALFSKSPLLGRLESPLLLIKSLKDKVENLEIRSIEMLIFALLKMDKKQGKLNSIMNRILTYAMYNGPPRVYEKRFVFLELALFYSSGCLAKQYIEKIIRDYLANSKSMPLEDTITLTRKIGLLDTQEDVIIERLVSVTLDNIDAFEPDSFLKQYMNLSRVGICNKELFKKVSNQECLKAFKKLTMNEKSAIFWEMVKSAPKKRYRTLLLPFFKALDLEQCSNSSSKNCMVLSYHTLEAVYKIDFLPKVKEQIAIFERELIQLQKNEVQVNKAHQDISQTLIKMGIEHENEVFVSGFFVDILIKEPKIIIEVDGKSHDMYRRRLSDKVKNEVLRANGYLLLRLSVDAFSDLPEDELKSMIRIELNDLLKSAEGKGETGSAQKRKISNYEKDMKRKRSGSY